MAERAASEQPVEPAADATVQAAVTQATVQPAAVPAEGQEQWQLVERPTHADRDVQILQWDYAMNGVETGSLYLKRDGNVAWYSNKTRTKTQWHGRWNRVGTQFIMVHFDFNGNPAKANYKWTWLDMQNEEGVDFKGRHIIVYNRTPWIRRSGGEGFL